MRIWLWVIILLVSLSGNVSAMRPVRNPELKESVVVRSELRNDWITVVDLGAFSGRFLANMKLKFYTYGIEHVRLIGIDDLSALGVNEFARKKFAEKISRDTAELGIEMIHGDFTKIYRAIPKADIVFVNAPMSVYKALDAADKILRDEGLIVIRMHSGENTYFIERWADSSGYKWHRSNFSNELPEGDYPLSEYTYILKKRPMMTDSVRTFFDVFKQVSQMERAA